MESEVKEMEQCIYWNNNTCFGMSHEAHDYFNGTAANHKFSDVGGSECENVSGSPCDSASGSPCD